MKKNYVLIPSLLIAGCKFCYAQNQPNILVLITDDQTYETIGALNNSEIHTPNLDRLVRQGTTFTHAFNQGSWSGAVSVASRSMLITGQYLEHARRNDTYLDKWARTKHQQSSLEVPLWGEVFKNAGYKTFITGKWHNSEAALLRSFDEGRLVGEGFNESRGADGKRLQYNRPVSNTDWSPSNGKLTGHWSPKVKDITVENGKKVVTAPYVIHRHTSEAYGDAAIDFLQKQQGDQPFFMYVAFNAPHDPRQSPSRFVEMYPREEISLPPNFLPEHPFDQGDKRVRDERLAPFPRTKEAVQLHRQEYYAIITHADEVIGRILDELERSGLDQNTIVIFTSDHGLAVGSHGLMGKQNLYDHTLRVPLIFKGPNIQANVRTDGMVYMQGIYATACDLAGIPTPETVDFPSLLPMLQKPETSGEQYIFGSYRHLQRMVRSEHYKLILYPVAKEIQFFDIQKDPYEKKNLAHKASYKKFVEEYFNILKQKQTEFEDGLDLGNLDHYLSEK